MAGVKSVKIDGETIHVFKSAIYIFETRTGLTLELDMIVSEVVWHKYRHEENLIIEIELEDDRIIHSIMHLKILPGRLPQFNLFTEIDDVNEYEDFERVSEYDSFFPNIEEGVTIEEIRKVEMPNEKISLKLLLPIDEVEWLREQKKQDLNELFKELIYEYWAKGRSN